ncbi:D-aminoacid aminotransferase-like PLP-dependent enzyme [Aspergillus uvarum CBS 121591]|uniref:D-aminoacid aminotransferase-like PLP-dependent enzyme n=1 Tax=Aspergillus uvarum CBS 121591 TaxID=1448315 RepID=A0A319CP38_9EURO|nr:D-aminoacid aminotransferase-like PLP-dependent enzyme [Aspergillus uvarum CBS 121591]PYH85841.1 D-aminoacid aminotransferase-like PLP-dependent enzyme [Aspergillus uvarum CBS 121591]
MLDFKVPFYTDVYSKPIVGVPSVPSRNLQRGDLVRGLHEAADRGTTYPFLTDGDTNLTEGSGFNIVIVKDGVLFTPQRGVLEGVTRKSVIDVARANGLDIRVELVPVETVYKADEIFMCTTAGGIILSPPWMASQ